MGLFDFFKKKDSTAAPAPTPLPDPESFPSYENSVDDTDFVLSQAARKIWDDNRPRRECGFLAQCLTDNRKYLDQFLVQSAQNPFVQNIGTDSEGVRFLALISAHVTQIGNFLDLVPSQMNLCLSQIMDAIGEASDTGETDALEQLAIDFMDPYIRLVAVYNDIATMESPAGSEEVLRCMKKAVKEMMDICAQIYDRICSEMFGLYNDLSKKSVDLNISLTVAFSDDSLPRAHKQIMANKDKLLTYVVRRRRF